MQDPSSELSKTAPLEQQQAVAVWDRLDRAARLVRHDRRRSQRHRYRSDAVILYIAPPDGEVRKDGPVLAPTRDISQGGLCFLHGAFLEPGTQCQVVLKTKGDQKWTVHEARVVRCRHLEGLMHEVGLQFEQEIDPAVYCSEAAAAE